MEYEYKYIYKISNDINNKLYIGQTTSIKRRMRKHKEETLNRVDVGRSAIHDAMRSFGFEHFKIEELGCFNNYDEMEKYYISEFNTLVPNGYNIQEGGSEPPRQSDPTWKSPLLKYSDELIDALIKDMLTQKYTQHELSEKYSVSQSLISKINLGEVRHRDTLKYPLIETSPYHLKAEDIADIKYILAVGSCSLKEISEYYNVNLSSIKAINQGRNHRDEGCEYPIRKFRGRSNSQPVEAILAKRSRAAIDTQPEM